MWIAMKKSEASYSFVKYHDNQIISGPNGLYLPAGAIPWNHRSLLFSSRLCFLFCFSLWILILDFDGRGMKVACLYTRACADYASAIGWIVASMVDDGWVTLRT